MQEQATAAVGEPGLRGPYTDLQGLIANQREAQSLILTPRRKATRQLAGSHQSRLKGRGMEFDDVRGYQPGDDVRNIDWRVTARTTVAHTKTFTEERERPVYLLCDQRGSMFFGSAVRYKSVQAANIASLLAWSALKRKDRVGGLLLGGNATAEYRAGASHRAVLQLLAGLNQVNHQLDRQSLCSPSEITLTDALAELRRVTKTGSTLFIISDFHDLDESGLRQLYELSRHNSVSAIAVYDPLERELPRTDNAPMAAASPGRRMPGIRLTRSGSYTISNGQQTLTINTADPQARSNYTRQALQRCQGLRDSLARLGIPLLETATTDDAVDSLGQLFQRARRRGQHA